MKIDERFTYERFSNTKVSEFREIIKCMGIEVNKRIK